MINDGIDGGLDAANAWHVPVVNKMVDAHAFAYAVKEHRASHAVVERVNAFPGQGVSSSFRFGTGYGILLGVLASSGVKIIDVAPGLWKRHFHLDSDKEKARQVRFLQSRGFSLSAIFKLLKSPPAEDS